MTTWSISWRMDVVFGGKNTIWTLVKFEIDGWAGQLSMIRAIFRSSARNFRSSLRTHSSKISLFIQLFFCDLYSQGRCLTFLKAAGIFRFLDHKHRQFFSFRTCCCHSSKPNFVFLPRNTFLLWGDMFYLGDINRKDRTRLHWKYLPTVWINCW